MLRTNDYRLDSDALLDMGSVWIITNLVWDDLRFTEGINERRATSAGRSCKKIDTMSGPKQRAESRELSSPTTMRVNWTPFLAFLRRDAIFLFLVEVETSQELR